MRPRPSDGPPPAPREPTAFERVLVALLRTRGAIESTFAPLDGTPAHPLGASLRLSFADGTVQDHALVAPMSTAAAFVGCALGLQSTQLDEAAILDALGETLNQVVGRLKNVAIEDGEYEPLVGVPCVVRAQSAVLCHGGEAHQRRGLHADRWPGAVAVLSSPREPLSLRLLAECDAVLAHATMPADLVRVQGLLVELEESLLGAPGSIAAGLASCDALAVQAIQSSSELAFVAHQIAARLDRLRPEVEARARYVRADFEVPAEEEDRALLWEYLEEANEHVAAARGALDRDGVDPVPVIYRALHTIKGNAGFFGLHQVQQLAHATEDLVTQLQSGAMPRSATGDGLCRRSLELLASYHRRLEDALQTEGGVEHQAAVELQVRHLQAIARGEQGPSLLAAADDAEDSAQAPKWLKLPRGDLDRLQSLSARLARVVEGVDDPQARRALGDIREELGSVLAAVLQVPLAGLLSKVARLARDTADQLGKLVRVETPGEGITVPKHVLTALGGPLVHLVRNAVDHGVESREERLAAGKPPLATIRCTARWDDGWLTVEVHDDGRGISPERIRAHARRLGVPDDLASSGGNDLLALLTRPGFTTAARVSEVSGRGVGLDVAHSEVRGIGGTLDIDSTPGLGTCFRIVVPAQPDLPDPCASSTPDELDEDFTLDVDGELNFL